MLHSIIKHNVCEYLSSHFGYSKTIGTNSSRFIFMKHPQDQYVNLRKIWIKKFWFKWYTNLCFKKFPIEKYKLLLIVIITASFLVHVYLISSSFTGVQID